MDPHRPAHISKYAEACLRALADHGLGERISLGGAFGLLHYIDYRTTHDVDAWWTDSATTEDQQRVIQVNEEALRPFGQVQTRAWGDVVSIELTSEGKTVFSFQVARRSAQLEEPGTLDWVSVWVDSLSDLLAGKMVALVERGAPRDFRDIHAVCHAHLTTPKECWTLWRRRQELSGGDLDPDRARLAVETHLARTAQHRPLEGIRDRAQRTEAEQLRQWFAQEFLNALSK
jgi:hypothetical protein